MNQTNLIWGRAAGKGAFETVGLIENVYDHTDVILNKTAMTTSINIKCMFFLKINVLIFYNCSLSDIVLELHAKTLFLICFFYLKKNKYFLATSLERHSQWLKTYTHTRTIHGQVPENTGCINMFPSN